MKRTNGFIVSRGFRARSVSAFLFIVFLGWSAAGFAQGTVQDQTLADFSQGTNSNTAIVLEDDGEVILAPAFTEEFTGPALGASWGSFLYTGGAAPSFSGGQVLLNGARIYSTATYGPGSVLEFEATFTQDNSQFMGFAISQEIGNTYVFIGRGMQPDNHLYLRRPSGGDISMGSGFLGAPHRFKIIWTTTRFEAYVDDATTPAAFFDYTVPSNMYLLASDYNPGASTMLSVDWMRVTPYAASGSYTSRVFDGGADVIWGAATWDAGLPASTDLSVFVRTGGTAIPDGTWTDFTEVPISGSVINQTARYIQYRADLSSSNTLFTPALRNMAITYMPTGNNAPSITLQPVSMTTCAGETASFTSYAIGNPVPWVSWESSPDGVTWTPVSGASSSTLSFTAASGDNNMRYRAVWVNGINPPAISNEAVLTVNLPLAAAIEAADDEICVGESVQLQINATVTNGQSPYTVVVNGETYTATSTGSPFVSFGTAELTIWPSSATPASPTNTDGGRPIEVGVKFRSSVPGFIKGIRFYNGTNTSGTRTGHLWKYDGTQMAEAQFTNLSTNAWQEVRFSSPVAIEANTTYIASCFSTSGYFAVTAGGLNQEVESDPLTALAHNFDGPNGVFVYDGGFPTSGLGSNYFVDVIFSQVGNNPISLTYNLTSVTDGNGCHLTGSPAINTVNVTVNPAPRGTIAPVRQNVYEGEEYEMAFTSTVGESPFTLEINGITYPGITSGVSFKAGIVSYVPPSSTIWPPSSVGGTQTVDSTSNTLGLKFRSSIPGTISGIRFYKHKATSLEFIISLWEEGNTSALHTQSYTTNNTVGWKQVDFPTPISIDPNKTYIASYYSVSQYAYAFTSGYSFPLTSGPLTALGCSYYHGLGYPANDHPANYWVDVVFASTAGIATFNLTTITSVDGCVAANNPISTATFFINQAKVWSGAGADAAWTTPENWSAGVVPSSVENVVIPEVVTHYPSVSGPLTTGALIIRPLASMTVNAGGALTVNGELRTTGAAMTIQSTAVNSSGSLIVNGAANGNVTYNRVMPASLYRYVSSPVVSTTLPTGTTFWKWNEAIGYWGDTSAELPVTACETGIGYTMLATGSGVAYTGGVLTGPVSVTATAPYGSNYVQNRGTWGGGGWNLFGNPYPSALKVVDSDGTSENDFIHHNLSSFDPGYQAVYIYDGTDYDYIALGIPGYTTGMGVFGSNDIQAGQGFFVLTHYNGLPFTFMPDMRTHNTGAVMTKSGSVPWPGVQLKVKAGTEEKATLIAYGEGMSAGLDPGYDVGHLSSGAGIEVYSVLAGGGSDYNFARQALPVSEAGSLVVPVGVDFAGGGEVTFSAFTIPLEGKKFWLEDRVAKTYTDLGTNSYTVTLPSNTYGTGRFFIIASTNTPTGIGQPEADDGGLRIWHSGGRVIIQGDVSEGSLCEIYKMNGAKVLAGKLTGGEMNTVDLAPGTNGVIIVRITDGIKVTTRKLAIPDRR